MDGEGFQEQAASSVTVTDLQADGDDIQVTIQDDGSIEVTQAITASVAEEEVQSSEPTPDESHDSSSTSKRKISNSPVSKQVKPSTPGSQQKYRKEWEALPEYQPWLTESIKPGYAFCMLCECDINIDKGKAQLTRHAARQKHVQNVKKAQKDKRVGRPPTHLQGAGDDNIMETDGVTGTASNAVFRAQTSRAPPKPLKMQVQLAEAQLVAFIVEHNLPLSLVDRLVSMIKELPSGGAAIKKIHLGKQKATNMVRQGFAPFFKDILVDKLKDTLFSVVIDEASDKSKNGMQLAICVCFCEEDLEVQVDLLEFVECDGSPEAIYGKLKECMGKIEHAGVSMKNWIGFRSDSHNEGLDSTLSVMSLIKEDYPWVVPIKCPVHIAYLSVSNALEKLPKNLEEFFQIVQYHFSSCPKQAASFVEFQEFFETEIEKLLAPGQTKWLSVHGYVRQVVNHWQALQLHFTNAVMEDNANGNDLALEILLNPIMRITTSFVEYVLGVVGNYTATFQTTEPLFFNILGETQELIRTLAKSFMTRESVASETDMMKLCVTSEENYLPLSETYLGYEASTALTAHMQQCQLSFEDPDVVFVLTSAREFYKEIILQIQARLDLNHPVFKFMSIIDPVKAFNTDPPSLADFFVNFGHPQWNKRVIEEEWRSVCLLGLPSDDILLSPTSFWKYVLNKKTPTGMYRFHHLRDVLLFFLSLPYSNMITEKIFTLMKDVRADVREGRKCLKTVTLSACLKSHCGLKRVPDALNNPHLRNRLQQVKSNAKSGDCDNIPILMTQ